MNRFTPASKAPRLRSGSFAAQVHLFADKANARNDAVRRAITLKLLGAVVLDTPVGNPDGWNMPEEQKAAVRRSGYVGGRLRGNWTPSNGQPQFTEGTAPDPSGQAVLGKVAATVATSRFGTDVWLTNSMPYAAAVEFEGHSHTQAPAGMVRKNAVRFRRLVAEAVRSGRLAL